MKLKTLIMESLSTELVKSTSLGQILYSDKNFKFNSVNGGYTLSLSSDGIYGYRLFKQKGNWVMAAMFQEISQSGQIYDAEYQDVTTLYGVRKRFDAVMKEFTDTLRSNGVSAEKLQKITVEQ